jgi:serine/threonine-protein kinase
MERLVGGPRRFGPFVLLARIATGGMAEVLLARRAADPEGAPLALKRLLPDLAQDRDLVAMLGEEARIAAALVDARICRVHEAGSVEHEHYLAMEYVRGASSSRISVRSELTR